METQKLVLAACIAVFVISLPLVFKLIPPNAFYGFRTAATLSLSDLWYQANLSAGLALIAASILSGMTILLVPGLSSGATTAVFVGSVLGAVMVCSCISNMSPDKHF